MSHTSRSLWFSCPWTVMGPGFLFYFVVEEFVDSGIIPTVRGCKKQGKFVGMFIGEAYKFFSCAGPPPKGEFILADFSFEFAERLAQLKEGSWVRQLCVSTVYNIFIILYKITTTQWQWQNNMRYIYLHWYFFVYCF